MANIYSGKIGLGLVPYLAINFKTTLQALSCKIKMHRFVGNYRGWQRHKGQRRMRGRVQNLPIIVYLVFHLYTPFVLYQIVRNFGPFSTNKYGITNFIQILGTIKKTYTFLHLITQISIAHAPIGALAKANNPPQTICFHDKNWKLFLAFCIKYRITPSYILFKYKWKLPGISWSKGTTAIQYYITIILTGYKVIAPVF